MNNTLKKIIYKLKLYDGVWSIPLSFMAFLLAGQYSYEYFGDALLSTEYLQVVFLASLVMICANFVVFMGLNLNFRSLQRYFYSRQIKLDVENQLSAWQRIKLYILVYLFFFCVFLFLVWMLLTVTASGLPQTITLE
jgi:ABC-type Fe3+ transport system permease subunit